MAGMVPDMVDMDTLVVILDMDQAWVATEAGMAAASALVSNNINKQSVKDLMNIQEPSRFFLFSKHF